MTCQKHKYYSNFKIYLYLVICILLQVIALIVNKKVLSVNNVNIMIILSAMFFWGICILLRVMLWTKVLKHMDLSLAYSLTAVLPILILLSSIIFFNEIITKFNILGAIMIMCGLVMIAISKKKK